MQDTPVVNCSDSFSFSRLPDVFLLEMVPDLETRNKTSDAFRKT
jgi:hypothetical protein